VSSSFTRHHWFAIAVGVLILAAGVRFAASSHQGERYDLGINQGWAKSGVLLGLAKSYTQQVDGNMLPNHAPLSIALFTLMGHVNRTFFSPEMDMELTSFRILIKVPAMLADLLTAIALGCFVGLWRGRRAGLR
jgi:hypothetical protein